MPRKSFTPLIKTTLDTYPNLKDNYQKLAEKVGCCKKTIKRYFENLKLNVPSDSIENHGQEFIPPRINKDFIDDPVELLTSTCLRELNKNAPDSRWASILLTLLDKTKKLEFKDVEEAQLQNQLRAKSISELISSKKQLIKL